MSERAGLGFVEQVRQGLWQQPRYSRAYGRWRRQFVRDRLQFAIHVAMVGLPFLYGVNGLLVEPLTQLGETGQFTWSWQQAQDDIRAVVIGLLCLSLGLWNVRRGHRAAIRGLPWFSISIVILPHVISWVMGSARVEGGIVVELALVFWAQAILVPVHWPVHLLSYGFVAASLLCFWALGLPEPLAASEPNLDSMTLLLGLGWTLFYGGLVLAVALFMVGYVERLLWREFDLREQLQLFLQGVSQDLRSPIQQTQLLLQGYSASELHGQTTSIHLSASTVQQILDQGQQQLDLLNQLLSAAQERESQ